MSQWTHVTGCIRFDGLPGAIQDHTVENVKKYLGNTCEFFSEREDWDKCNVPCGSEGSLQYKVLEVGGGLIWLTVAIWGDLRSYDNVTEIKEWFERVTHIKGLSVRGAVLEIEVENQATIVLQFKQEVEDILCQSKQ